MKLGRYTIENNDNLFLQSYGLVNGTTIELQRVLYSNIMIINFRGAKVALRKSDFNHLILKEEQ
jgi:Fe2+ transport system protein FeoA